MTMEASSFISRSQSRENRADLWRCVHLVESDQEAQVLVEVESLFEREQDNPVAFYLLSLLALRHDLPEVALESLQKASQKDIYEPLYSEALSLLYLWAGNLTEGVYLGKLSLSQGFSEEIEPLLPKQFLNFSDSLEEIQELPLARKARAFQKQHYWADTIRYFKQHLAFHPHDFAAKRELAQVFLITESPSQALACLEDLREASVAQAEDFCLMAQACLALGEPEAAEAYHQQADAVATGLERESLAWVHLANLLFYPGADATRVALSARNWGQSWPVPTPQPAPAVTGRRIRVGYLISSLVHPKDVDVLAAVLVASNPQQFEIYLYGVLSADSSHNSSLRGCYDEWRDIKNLDPETVIQIIQGDGIDLLIDAGGLGAPLHAQILALRGAPRQVGWLGNTTGTLGITAVDAEFVDGNDPDDRENPTGEDGARRLALPYGLYCFDRPLPPVRTPALAGDGILFGADVTLAQLHPELLSLWGRVLAEVPNARLVLRDRNFAEDGQIDRLVSKFQGVNLADRIELNNCSEKEFYREVDVALMPLVASHPHDAMAALNEGTPVVAMSGPGRPRRIAANLLRQAGLETMVAETAEGYVSLARQLAVDSSVRAKAIEDIIQAFQNAPIFDPDTFGAAFDEFLLDLAQTPVDP